jgi:hypothetical protein
MPLRFAKHERVWLRDSPDFSEAWLHDRIGEDTAILGFGELDVIARERVQHGAGRLDMLLADSENSVRYEVEIMLGSTDPSHIIRCIEYWDIERRRYPAYDHVAVLVAEEVTSRFVNVMGLLAGSIPLVAIQLNALKVGDQIVLDFVKVLDQRELREDDTVESGTGAADRNTWEERVGSEVLRLCDRIVEIANEVAEPRVELKYQKRHLGLCPHGSFFNVGAFFPKKAFLAIRMAVADSDVWLKRFEEAGVQVNSRKPGRVTIRIRPVELSEHEALLRELIHQSVREFQSA